MYILQKCKHCTVNYNQPTVICQTFSYVQAQKGKVILKLGLSDLHVYLNILKLTLRRMLKREESSRCAFIHS